jgi:hypothetical protein
MIWNAASDGEAFLEMVALAGKFNACQAITAFDYSLAVVARAGGRSSIPEQS